MRRRFLGLALLVAALACAQAPAPTPINDLPQPYTTSRDWARPPNGAPWAAVTAVEVAPDGSVFVIHRCRDNSCAGRPEPPILKFDPSGKLLQAFGENLFVFPHGATIDPEGNLWVADQRTENGKGAQVFKFSPDGRLLMTLGKAGVASAEPGLFDEPTDVAVNQRGEIFVSEGHSGGTRGNDRISKFDRNGKFIKSWASAGSGPGNLRSPHTLAFDSRGRLLVGDRDNNRIQIFDQEGNLLDSWKQWGRPSGIFIAPGDTMTWPIPSPGVPTIRVGRKASASAAPATGFRGSSLKIWNRRRRSTAVRKVWAWIARGTSTAPSCAGRCWSGTRSGDDVWSATILAGAFVDAGF